MPQAAIGETAREALQLERLDSAQILEARIDTVLSESTHPETDSPGLKGLLRASVSEFLEAVSAPTAAPAAGAVAALTAALAGALGVMAARLSRQPAVEHGLDEIGRRLSHLLEADGKAYNTFVTATRLPAEDTGRPVAISSALHVATEIPLEMAEQSAEAATLLAASSHAVKPRLQSDVRVGLILAIAAAEASLHTALENLKIQPNQQLRKGLMRRVQDVSENLEELKVLCYTPPPGRSDKKSLQALPEKVQTRDEWKSKSSTIMSRKRSKSRRKNLPEKGSSAN